MKFSALIHVFNEELCLPYSLGGLLPVVDECIIVDGSEVGISTDGTKAIIENFQKQYGDKITYLSGTYNRDGSWDNTAQNNVGLSHVTGDFVMRTHGDLVYDVEDVANIREIVEKYSYKKLFYCPMIDFFVDTNNHLLSSRVEPETKLRREICGDAVAYSMESNPRYVDYIYKEKWVKSGIAWNLNWDKDILYLPHIKRFHYASVKPFKYQIAKYVRNVIKSDMQELGDELKAKGRKAIFDWAIDQVKTTLILTNGTEYAGEYPIISEPIRHITAMDGYDEFMDWYNSGTDYERSDWYGLVGS